MAQLCASLLILLKPEGKETFFAGPLIQQTTLMYYLWLRQCLFSSSPQKKAKHQNATPCTTQQVNCRVGHAAAWLSWRPLALNPSRMMEFYLWRLCSVSGLVQRPLSLRERSSSLVPLLGLITKLPPPTSVLTTFMESALTLAWKMKNQAVFSLDLWCNLQNFKLYVLEVFT